MELINNKQLSAIHALLNKLDMMDDKKAIVEQYSNGRTTSSKELTKFEAKALIGNLKSMLPQTDEEQKTEKMKNKIIGMAHDIGWEIGDTGKIDMPRLNNWCIKTGAFAKELDDHNSKELVKLVSQFERVYEWNMKNR
jgi:hypothetical protein